MFLLSASLTTQQIALYVALLVALALVVALIARARVRRKPFGELPAPGEQQPGPEGRVAEEARRVPIAVPKVELPAERLERESRARTDIEEAARSLAQA